MASSKCLRRVTFSSEATDRCPPPSVYRCCRPDCGSSDIRGRSPDSYPRYVIHDHSWMSFDLGVWNCDASIAGRRATQIYESLRKGERPADIHPDPSVPSFYREL